MIGRAPCCVIQFACCNSMQEVASSHHTQRCCAHESRAASSHRRQDSGSVKQHKMLSYHICPARCCSAGDQHGHDDWPCQGAALHAGSQTRSRRSSLGRDEGLGDRVPCVPNGTAHPRDGQSGARAGVHARLRRPNRLLHRSGTSPLCFAYHSDCANVAL